ncbi:V-type ATP synthase subunit I [Ectothiorhodospiraceae bacterium WFHF3C12]|nr:V-type ATP synthase subunit I [Ectothiorhodospiraceae bacterium WFHF3C12]
MSIVTLKRATVLGLESEKAAVLQALQALGALHLIPVGEETPPERPAEPERTVAALKYLLACPARRRQRSDDAAFNLKSVVNDALENQQRSRQAEDWADFLRQRIKQVEPWGDFRFPALEDLAGQRLWFYVVPHYKMRWLEELELPWQLVHRDSRNSFVVVIAPDEPPADALPVPRTHTGALSLGELRQRLDRVESELDQLALERESLTQWIGLMTRHLDHAADAADLRHALGMTRDTDGLFALQGWLPADREPALRALAEQRGLAVSVSPATADDRPPTLLANRGPLAAGEEIVDFYQMPGYRNWDPSPVLFLSFAGFFAMIMADAGYALVIAALLALFGGRLSRTPRLRRLRTLAWTIAATAFAYGTAVGSYFGTTPPPASLPGRFHVLDLNDFDVMMNLSIGVGAAHLLVANGVTAWQRGLRRSALAPAGWFVAILGGLGLWQGVPGSTVVLAGGLGLVLLFSGDTAGPTHRGLLWRLWSGLLGLSNVTKAFGDVLSYLRLFALGLASASLAVTFNQLASDAAANTPGIGTLLFVLIVLLGHALNFTLCVVSGLVHGLRLNVIEFYHWGVADEGYPFKAFARRGNGSWKS